MLMYGSAQAADMFIKSNDVIIFNLTSLNERYYNARLDIFPPNSLGANSEYEYDQKYYEWVYTNDIPFINIMKIIMALYNGLNVFLVVTDEWWSDVSVESLLKMIQARYGINAVLISNMDDLIYAQDSTFEPTWGLYNLDQDRERYTTLVAKAGGFNDVFEEGSTDS